VIISLGLSISAVIGSFDRLWLHDGRFKASMTQMAATLIPEHVLMPLKSLPFIDRNHSCLNKLMVQILYVSKQAAKFVVSP
jgi:hypothetical protein